MQKLKPQPGPQELFLSSSADIVIYGGAAGGGKTHGLLLEAARHKDHKGFGAVIFRRTFPQIKKKGGLWETSASIYPLLGGDPIESALTWKFNTGTSIDFAHLQHEKDKYDWQGAQIPLLMFDEVTHFTYSQFFYMLSRNRTTCGIRPYVRATCNPDAASWLVKGGNGWGSGFISWWIDNDGLAIPERSGVIRWFIRINDELVWGDSEQELLEQYPDIPPKSLTFIHAALEDNQILMKADPGYRATLLALPLVEREQLLGANWKIEPSAGLYFKRGYFDIVDKMPAGARYHRHWDFAASEVSKKNKDPDWIVGLLLASLDGRFYVVDVQRAQLKPLGVEQLVRQTAEIDGKDVPITAEQEPGSSGKIVIDYYARNILEGYNFTGIPSTTNKISRAGPASSAAENGNVSLVRGSWNHAFISEVEAFPTVGVNDDQVDGLSGAHQAITEPVKLPPNYSGQTVAAGYNRNVGYGGGSGGGNAGNYI